MMVWALPQQAKAGESGEGDRMPDSYPRLAIGARRLSSVGIARDELRRDGCNSRGWPDHARYPDSVPDESSSYS